MLLCSSAVPSVPGDRTGRNFHFCLPTPNNWIKKWVPKQTATRIPQDFHRISIGFILDSSWIHPGFILDSSWIHPGLILDSSWTHPGFILDSSWTHPGLILDSSWTHPGFIRFQSLGLFALRVARLLCVHTLWGWGRVRQTADR